MFFPFFFIRKASELEASKGHRGSADVRKEALHALRILIAKVRRSIDALVIQQEEEMLKHKHIICYHFPSSISCPTTPDTT